mmetsp:Transcript_64206/g.133961  ORF Transcript_64206/g.133961 Transcript_64206/m.133961 type:complete len:229 (-) Transcript_64206:602-1288(-)
MLVLPEVRGQLVVRLRHLPHVTRRPPHVPTPVPVQHHLGVPPLKLQHEPTISLGILGGIPGCGSAPLLAEADLCKIFREHQRRQVDGVPNVKAGLGEGDALLHLADLHRRSQLLHGLAQLLRRLLKLLPALRPFHVHAVAHPVLALENIHVDLKIARWAPRQQFVSLDWRLPHRRLILRLFVVFIVIILFPLLAALEPFDRPFFLVRRRICSLLCLHHNTESLQSLGD